RQISFRTLKQAPPKAETTSDSSKFPSNVTKSFCTARNRSSMKETVSHSENGVCSGPLEINSAGSSSPHADETSLEYPLEFPPPPEDR
ncbi:hypothetical protein ACHAXS_008768, partial [Conticribra weissflogii]